MRRRLLSLCLVLCMVLGMLPVMAMAAEPACLTVKAGEAEYEAACVDTGSVYAVQIPEVTAVTIGKSHAAAGDYTAANVSGGLLVSFQEYPLELTAEELSKCILTEEQKANCGDVGIDLSIGNWACIILSDGEVKQDLFLLLGDAGVMAVDAKGIPVADNVIDITDKELYKRSSNMYINAVNITVSGADVVSATEDGTTVNVVLDAATAMDAEVSVTFGTSGKNCSVSGHTGKVTLENGEGTLSLAVRGYLTSSMGGTVNYTINFKVDAELTEPPIRLMESDSKDGYTGVAMEINLKDYFKLASTYYLVEGENLTELDGKSYAFTPAVGGTHTLTFAAGNVVGMCPDYVTVTVEATELKSGIWVLYETSSGSFNYIRFTDANGQSIDGLTASIDGTAITVELPQSYDLSGKVTAAFNLNQNASGYPFLSTKTGTAGTSSNKAVNNKVSAMTTALSGGKGTATVYYFNSAPNGSNQIPFTINYKIFNNLPAFVEDVVTNEEKTIKAVTDTYNLDLSKLFTDKDEQALTYKVSINDGAYTACEANYSFNTDLAGTYVLKFKANDGQDDSADIYTVTLTVENSDETYAVSVAVTEDIDGLTFYADGLSGEVLTYEDGSVQVPLNVKAIWWKTADGMTGTATVSDGFTLNLQKTTFVVKTALGDVDSGSKITVTDPDGNTVAGKGFVYLLDSGAGYTYKATSSISGWAANTLKDQTVTSDPEATVEITLLVDKGRTITVDKGADLKVYYQPKYYVLEEVKPVYSVDNGDTVTNIYSCTRNEQNSTGYLYFAKKDGYIDKAGYLTMVTDTTVTWAGETRTSSYRGTYDRSTRFGKRGDDSVLVNVNSSGHLVLNQGSTYRLRALRIWEIIDHDSGNVIIEPEFTYTNFGADVITLSNVTNRIPGASGNNWVDMKATGSGVAFLEVGYEALHIVDGLGEGEIELSAAYGQPNNFTWNASDPTRTALVVVQTDGNAATDVTFGIRNNSGGTWDAEYDTLYFTGSYGQLTFAPSASSGISNVAVSNNKGESFTALTADENGAYTAAIVPGANVIRITNGNGKTAYQVVRGDQVTITVTNITEGKNGNAEIQPGDTVRVDFAGIHSPMGKTSGLFNSNSHQVLYYGNGETEHLSEYEGYELPGGASMELTIPQDAQGYTLTGGCISFSGWGKFNMHRSLTDNGLPQNTGADKLTGKRVSLPDIELLADNTTYTVTLSEGEGYTIAACEGSENPVKQGGSFSFTVSVNEGYEGTPVVKIGDTELSAVDGVYTIEDIMADVTVTVEGVEKAEETVTNYPLTIVAPIGSTVSVGTMRSNFIYTFAESLAVTQDYDAGTVTFGFNIPDTKGSKFLRVQNPKGVTYWDYNSKLGTEGTVITITEDMLFMNDSSFNANTVYRNFEHGNDVDVADVLLNANEKGYINLSTGGTYELNVIRDWMAVESMMNNKTVLPDVSYQVIDFYGNQSNVLSVTPDANNSSVATITANASGTAVVLVTYDAMYSTEALQDSQSAFGAPEKFSAIWPENTGVLVVSVDQNGTSLTTNMTLNANNTSSKLAGTAIDAEHDVLYYVGSEGASYTFTPPAGSTVSIARASLTSQSLTYNGFSAVPANADGSVTLTGLTTGSHIVKVERGGVATYQVIGAKQTSYTIVDAEGNPINEEHKAQPGETLTITLGDVYSGLNKVSTFYNPNCAIRYVGQDGTKASYKAGDNYDQYNFAACSHVLTITLPDQWVNETYSLTGYLANTGYGSPAGSHRALRYATGSSTNENATICMVNLGQLAPIDIPVEVSQRVPATGITLSKESLTLVLGGVTKLSAAIEPADTTDSVVWSSSDESVVKVTGDGFLTAVSQGSATITAAAGDVSAACEVTVPAGGENLVITTPTQTNERFITSITLHGVGAATAEKTATRDYNVSLPAGSYDTLTITDRKSVV